MKYRIIEEGGRVEPEIIDLGTGESWVSKTDGREVSSIVADSGVVIPWAKVCRLEPIVATGGPVSPGPKAAGTAAALFPEHAATERVDGRCGCETCTDRRSASSGGFLFGPGGWR